MSDLEAHRRAMLRHFVSLYRDPLFGPNYTRHAVREFISNEHCSYPDIGHAIRDELQKDQDGDTASKAPKRGVGTH